MLRYELINAIIERYGYRSYLEIGVNDPSECFDRIKCALKEGVDPWRSSPAVNYCTSSDQAFLYLRSLGRTFDLIFVDGYHQESQVDRDINNSLELLNDEGTLVLHDANPPSEAFVAEYVFLQGRIHMLRPHAEPLCGTVYRSVVKFNQENEAHAYVVSTEDYGCAVIRKPRGRRFSIDFSPLIMSFQDFDRNRKALLNLIDPDEFVLRLGTSATT